MTILEMIEALKELEAAHAGNAPVVLQGEDGRLRLVKSVQAARLVQLQPRLYDRGEGHRDARPVVVIKA